MKPKSGRSRRAWALALGAGVVCVARASAWGVVVNGSGQITASGADLGAYLGAGAFYSAGYTGTRAVAVNIEGGQAWNGHQSLAAKIGYVPLVGGAAPAMVNHATGVSGVIGGRGTRPLDQGIAFDAGLYSGSLATFVNTDGAFGFSAASFGRTYRSAMAGFTPVGGVGTVRADVINSSWSSSGGWTGYSSYTEQLDGLVARYGTAVVVAAGNSGPDANTVGLPAAAFNVITVAALRSDTAPEVAPAYNSVSDFSSRGPSAVRLGGGGGTVYRAAVSIAAPGENFSVAGFAGAGTVPNYYFFNARGTSYAAPTVAGAAALLADVARDRFEPTVGAAAYDGRVIKAVLLNSADKTRGWDNGQTLVSGVVRTTQALDYAVGTGRLNMARAFGQFTAGTTGTATPVGNTVALVQPTGWDFDAVTPGGGADRFSLAGTLVGGSILTATLTWFTDTSYNDSTDVASLSTFANLSLEVYRLGGAGGVGGVGVLVAVSDTFDNPTEHLSFAVPGDGEYQLRVSYVRSDYNLPAASVPYALAWSATAYVPEPVGAAAVAGVVAVIGRRRRG